MWAEYYEKHGVSYAFFSAANAAAAQEQADRMWRRENDISDSEDEGEAVEGEVKDDEDEYPSGEEVEAESEEEEEVEAEISDKLEQTTLDADYEEGWSTEGEEDEEDDMKTKLDKRTANGEKVPMRDIVAEVNERAVKEGEDVVEDERTRVLSVTELEDLFVNSAPELHCMSLVRFCLDRNKSRG